MNANPATQDTLLQLLIDNGALTPEQVQEVREEQERTGHSVHKIVSDHGLISEDDLLTIIANHLGTTIVDLQEMEIAPATMQTIPASAARMYNIVPIALKPSAVVLATSQLLPPEIIDEIRFVLTRDISFVMARSEDIKNLIGRFYGSDNASIDELLASLESEFEQDVGLQLREGKEGDETGVVEAANAAPVVRLVNLILYEA
ncbi:MAG: hypothetical protein GX806_01715, partial [Lentisphaerae bacterium]|nr:hypothetical protein [Lentisphaerota bacterium]